MATLREPTIDIRDTLGVVLVGILLSCTLFGIFLVQVYVYYSKFPNDRLHLKGLVFLVWLFELGHCICICHTLYFFLVNRFGDPGALVEPPTSLGISVGFGGVVAPLVQLFFIHRVLIIGRKLLIPVICWILTAVRMIFLVITTVESLRMSSLNQFREDWNWIIVVLLGISGLVDAILLGSLAHFLRKPNHDPFKRNPSLMLNGVIAWTIQTGFMSMLTGVIMLTCFLALPYKYVWISIYTVLPRVFSFSLMASLNGRFIPQGTAVIELQSVVAPEDSTKINKNRGENLSFRVENTFTDVDTSKIFKGHL